MPVQKMCKDCGRSIIVWSTLQTRCPKCQQARSKAKPPRKIKQVGGITKKWLATRRQWFKENMPNEQGFYICYLCNKWLDHKETTLDHIKNRSSHPELRYEMSNLAPCCSTCNTFKGSQSLENYLKTKSARDII